MAEEHNAIKYGSIISNAASIAAGGGYGDVGVSRLGETLQPVIDLWRRPEWALLRGERLWAVNPSNVATAAEFTQVGVRNPAGSGLIVVVTDFNTSHAATNQILEMFIGASVAVDSTSTPNARDTRLPILTGVRTVSLATSGAARLGSRLATFNDAAITFNFWTVNVVLSPGFDLYFGPDTVNQAVSVSIRGYERVAFPGELQARG